MGQPKGLSWPSGVNKFQGVIVAELCLTLALFVALKTVHFCIWGHLQQKKVEEKCKYVIN
jgi:hypothetical protein